MDPTKNAIFMKKSTHETSDAPKFRNSNMKQLERYPAASMVYIRYPALLLHRKYAIQRSKKKVW